MNLKKSLVVGLCVLVVSTVVLVTAKVIIDVEMEPYHKADRIQQFLESRGYLVTRVYEVVFESKTEVCDWTWSWAMWWVNLQESNQTNVQREGCVFYYLDEDTWFRFDVKAYQGDWEW